MNKKKFLVEYLSNISTVIKQPLQQTHRIKFTCFDVSRNFIVFGATSGGIYIFNRCPCKFIKLLPNKEGSITNILINNYENSVAICTAKGLVVVIENCFLDSNKYQLYSEHEGHVITASKWHYNELYIGDETGRISVIELTNKQSIFQSPYATLMHLDSGITQLDCYDKYLLASTKTRTYICDTEKERYGQIGKKLRDGNFGACFYSKSDSAVGIEAIKRQERTIFKNVQENESFSCDSVDGVTIYCARPGSRIWEAKFDGSVVCTHQFKESFKVKSSRLIHVSEEFDISDYSHVPNMPFNFGKICMFGKFILTFCHRGVFIFDIASVKLLYWTDYFQGIEDVKIIDNVLYIWCGKFYLKTLHLMGIEDIIMTSLSSMQYLLCSKLCLYFKEDLLEMVKYPGLERLKILKQKISDANLLEELSAILDTIPEIPIKSQKLRNGIFVVDSAPESLSILEKKPEETLNPDDLNSREAITILYNQYQINKISKDMDTPKCLELIKKIGIEDFISFYKPFITHVSNINNPEKNHPEIWFYSFVLRYISKNNTDLSNPIILDFVKTAFLSLNLTNAEHTCKCLFPLPTAKDHSCQYYEIGCELLKYLDFSEICKHVPYVYKQIIECDQNDVSLLLQYDDFELFQRNSKQFTYDVWDDCCKLLLKLRRNICLNCDNHFNANVSITWTNFSTTMLKSLGGSSTIKLLSRYAKDIKPGEINHDFYQLCIVFSTMEANISKRSSVKFLENIENNSNIAKEVERSVEKYLSMKSSGAIQHSSIKHSCSVCDNPKMPILDEFIKLKCGHVSHRICSIDIKVCKLCTEN